MPEEETQSQNPTYTARDLEEAIGNGDADRLCQLAGVDGDENVTQFVMSDVAAALIHAEWPGESIVKALSLARPSKYADALLEASDWPTVFETVAAEGLHNEGVKVVRADD